jgi:hypothetical protein
MSKRDFVNDPLTIDYMLDSGLVFEINRSLLHLFGIALTVKQDKQGNKAWSFKDVRKEPEALKFDAATLELGRKKFEAFLKEFGFPQMRRREKANGKSMQHVQCWS